MNKTKYTPVTIDALDTKLLTVKEACTVYRMSRNTLMKFAKDNNAIVKIGRSVRVIPKEMDASLELYRA